MTQSFDLLIRGGIVATPNGIAEADIGVAGGRIAAIGSLANARAAEIFDARGLHVLPGPWCGIAQGIGSLLPFQAAPSPYGYGYM